MMWVGNDVRGSGMGFVLKVAALDTYTEKIFCQDDVQ